MGEFIYFMGFLFIVGGVLGAIFGEDDDKTSDKNIIKKDDAYYKEKNEEYYREKKLQEKRKKLRSNLPRQPYITNYDRLQEKRKREEDLAFRKRYRPDDWQERLK